jgi:outer membrane lipoprotein LolB
MPDGDAVAASTLRREAAPPVRKSIGRYVFALPRLALAAGVLVLAACTTVTRAPPASPSETLSGRLSIRVDAEGATPARTLTAAFELNGGPRAGRLDLSTPLGSILAQARWEPGEVVLATPRGESRFADLDALTRQALGESVPVAALFDWLQGRPWPGAASTPAPAGAGFAQLGWAVDLERFDDAWVTAKRDSPPPVTVRIKIDRH